MDAVGLTKFVFEVERFVGARLVLVADDIVRARDHAAGTARTEPAGDDLVVELFPLVSPALFLGGGSRLSDGHRANLASPELVVANDWEPIGFPPGEAGVDVADPWHAHVEQRLSRKG